MLTKIVDGVSVKCSAEEEAAILSEWAANANKPAPAPVDPVAKLKNFLASNPDVMKAIQVVA